MLSDHYGGLRRNARYRDAIIMVYIEANMSFVDAKRVRNLLMGQEFGPPGGIEVAAFDSKKEQRFGVWTDNPHKEAYAIELQQQVPHMRFAVEGDFISGDARQCRKDLCDQLKVFRKEIFETSATSPCYKACYTGKSAGRKDDFVMALGIALYYMKRAVCCDEAFRQRMQRLGKTP